MKKTKGLIFILSGPSGSGKTTLLQQLLKDKSIKLTRSVSYTTRRPRKGEEGGRDYFFISQQEFFKKKRDGDFLETQRVFDKFYGTPVELVRRSIEKGRDILLCIDVKGAKVVKKKYPEAIMIFIDIPSVEELSSRLDNRLTESQRSKAIRLKVAKKELAYKKHYAYEVTNDCLARATRELKQIIKDEQFKRRKS